uniref:Putative peptide/nitrate transporter At2g37900 n=1 Tax=Anthurium amnicola TaxID=1678845 RepID=A0A1D1YRY3_9ARAE
MTNMEVELARETRSGEKPEEKWVHDSSVDHRGRAPLRASTGVWKAALFIIAIEFSERLSYFGLSTNLIVYLTRVLKEETKTAAKNVNYWVGVTTVMPLLGGLVADAYLGRFSTVIASTLIYLAGLGLLTMSRFVPELKPSDGSLRVHETVFFVAMYLISAGTGGHKPALESFGADQFDDDHAGERIKKMSFFNWWNFGLCSGLLLGVTAIVYVQDHVGWGAADVILTAVMAASLLVFCHGRPYYRYRVPEGSPLTPLLQVLVAAFRKRHLPLPADPAELHEAPRTSQKRPLCHTGKLRFLDRAALVEGVPETKWVEVSPWRLATVTQVEETKLVVGMLPIWVGTLAFGLCVAQASTFFIKQSLVMDRRLGSFVVPPATIFALAAVGMVVAVVVYEKLLVPTLRAATGNERGITILRRIGIGMAFSVVAMAVAAVVETERRARATTAPMSAFWLAPQYMILGIGDGFALVGLQEYFYDQVPDSMRSLGIAFYLSVIGASNFISGLLITVVDRVTTRLGKGWFDKDLNKSRLDYFYWLLAAIGAANLVVYVYLASRYTYKNVQKRVASASGDDDDDDLEKK